jgi:hypothetical protein
VKLKFKERFNYLEEIKKYSRSKENSDPIYDGKSLHLFLNIAFVRNETLPITTEALSVIANSMFLVPTVQQHVSEYIELFQKLITEFKVCTVFVHLAALI